MIDNISQLIFKINFNLGFQMDKIKNNCIDCNRFTNHSVLASHKIKDQNEHYDLLFEYTVVQFLGCDHISFLKTIHDYGFAYPIKEIWTANGREYEYDYDRTFTNFYPDGSIVFNKLEKQIPEKLFQIYSEAKTAFIQNLDIFTAIGIRAIIECICKDKKVVGRDLEKRITNLKSLGDISKRDIELLHSLRFLGNEAVHELVKPKRKDLQVAFKIVDHLIQTIYVMPKELEHTNFKKHIGDYETFENCIKENISELDEDKIYKITPLLGEKSKISHSSLKELELLFKSKITSNEVTWIEIVSDINLLPSEESNQSEGTFYKIKKAQ